MAQLDTPCLNWSGAKTTLGYGRLHVGGKCVYAHRVSYCDANGCSLADIAGVVVRHKCDNPSCFHPEHLEIGTQGDNMRDMWARGRGRSGFGSACRGEKNTNAKLTDADIKTIRGEYVRMSRTHGCGALGRRFGVDQALIHRIVRRESWRHVP